MRTLKEKLRVIAMSGDFYCPSSKRIGVASNSPAGADESKLPVGQFRQSPDLAIAGRTSMEPAGSGRSLFFPKRDERFLNTFSRHAACKPVPSC